MDVFGRPLLRLPHPWNRGLMVTYMCKQYSFSELRGVQQRSRGREESWSKEAFLTRTSWGWAGEIQGNSGKMKEPVSALKELKKAFYFLIIYCKLIPNSLVLRECRAEEWVRTSVETRRPNYQASIPLRGHRRVPWWLWAAMLISIFTSDILWHYE